MDRHVPAASVRRSLQQTTAQRAQQKWRTHGFPSEEDMLDWLENQRDAGRFPPGLASHAHQPREQRLLTRVVLSPFRGWR